MAKGIGIPVNQGLYDSEFEKDNCGIGLVADIKGKKSHDIIKKGIQVLERIEHRGAVGADPTTGDGAGMLMQIPHKFFSEEVNNLPDFGNYGIGQIFLPQNDSDIKKVIAIIEETIKEEGQTILTWRDVPVDLDNVGVSAKVTMPTIKQVFIVKNENETNFDKRLYIIRKVIENKVTDSDIEQKEFVYMPSMSSNTIVYKGLLLADQVAGFYKDLRDERVESAFALVHQRYSTNTFPSWDLAHPFRYIAHNGEINTIKGNVNWMASREPALFNEIYGDEVKKIFPINKSTNSDSANLDNALEFLIQSGKPLIEAAALLVPRAWEKDGNMNADLKAFYEYYSGLMEPWDGPAALAMSNGKEIVCMLDRNGLRPSRYLITNEDILILASEAGTVEVPFENVKEHGRVTPGKIMYINLCEGRIYTEEETIKKIAGANPYRQWLNSKKRTIDDIKTGTVRFEKDFSNIVTKMKAFGFTREDLQVNIAEMANNESEPLGSMGNDAALAVLSNKSKHLFHYFKQLFAQVTNPPIDPIREDIVMSYTTLLGVQGNILADNEDKANVIKLSGPVISNEELDKIVSLNEKHFKTKVLDSAFIVKDGLEKGLESLFASAEKAIEEGNNILVISDREVTAEKSPIPSLLATAGLHHHLIRNKKRNGIDLIIETGEAKEIMQFATLIGYGALAINPYLALETIEYMCENELYTSKDNAPKKKEKFVKAANKSILKTISKMGISTIQSYRGAQIFEAVGLAKSVIDKYFVGTPSRIEGIDLSIIEKETLERHKFAFDNRHPNVDTLPNVGDYKWRKYGERRLFSPEAVSTLQFATRTGNYEEFKKYTKDVDGQAEALATIRGLFKFKGGNPISIDEVEPVESITKRFVTGAMSYGSISQEAHEALAIAMNTLGGKSNSGEGGENPERFGDKRRSAIKQVASGRFGVTTHYLVNADELQIKMAQGAKPGEGGHLPGHKVSEEIAATRHTSPGIDLISPPPHHDIYSIEDLAQLIFDLKNVNPQARVSVKLVSEVGVGTVAAGVSKAHADMILISGYDGGTGAAPLSSIKHAGLPWELGLSEAHQVLVLNDLRGRVRVQADGQMKTGRDLAIAALLGAEEFGFATAPLVVLGCVMMRACHTNLCPVGVATQSPELRKKFVGRSEYLINFFKFIAQELREIMATLGFRKIEDMVGRTEYLEMNEAISHWKANGIDISKILYRPNVPESIATKCVTTQDHGIDKVLDNKLIELAKPALDKGEKVVIDLPVFNTNRTVGTMLSGKVAKIYGGNGLEDDTITLNFKGYAGQSFGTFGMHGITYNLEGQANDYVGKGLFGGKIILKAPQNVSYTASNNIIAGNTCLFGAIRGEAYINGRVGERFCVRNSGATAVVEGLGDHGCEYMTGGRVVVLGETGRNFGAGMSGGIAYVYDINNNFDTKANKSMVVTETLDSNDIIELKTMIENHFKYTGSTRAKEILDDFDSSRFVKVIAPKYKELLAQGKVK
ncbi:MAG: glutamate synthase large subunit [Fusobacteriaceae bacterium]|nr:glutamate synthase large subunit [Fusobacteriaceae bacterium]